MDEDLLKYSVNYSDEIIQKKIPALDQLCNDMMEREQREPFTFPEFLLQVAKKPRFMLRDIFQLFYDMVHFYIPEGIEEYPELGESIGYIKYDAENLFVKNCDYPFFADRLFINRLMNLLNSFKQGSLNNHIILFEGPPGSGKSTFLNNLLIKLEEYTRTNDGAYYKTFWRLDADTLNNNDSFETNIKKAFEEISDKLDFAKLNKYREEFQKRHFQFSCPRHDHPILQIPKQYRKRFLEELIPDKEFINELMTKKEYEWVLKEQPCNICQSIFNALFDQLNDPHEVFKMINVRKMHFNRQFGEGVSVFNPGDPIFTKPIVNKTIEKNLQNILKTDYIEFVYSDLAKTNNGVYALMDIKEDNIERLKSLHGIISDGVHKVELIEERVKSIYFGLVNPEDKKHYEGIQSFQDRIITVNIPYILDFHTEVEIYKNKFGENILPKFLPGVLQNFAKIIISSRLDTDTPVIKRWLGSIEKYSKYIDKNGLLLKMDIYTGKIPDYLNEEDINKFDRTIRKEILNSSESEGKKGFSGRQSLNIFGEFLSKNMKNGDIINMDTVQKFFANNDKLFKEIPSGFLMSLCDLYDYNVLQEVKESIYDYNANQISREIQNYLYSINFDIGESRKCNYTNDIIDISEDYFKSVEIVLLGIKATDAQRKNLRNDIRNEYISKTLAQEINLQNKTIIQTEQYQLLFDKYTRNLKENALLNYSDNDNFKRALKDCYSDDFEKYDEKTKRNVNRMITNLQSKFKYSVSGAREISIYVLEKNLNKKYS